MNIDLATQVHAVLNSNPGLHNQSAWTSGNGTMDPDDNACGTTGCIAGWAVALAGHKIQTIATESEPCGCSLCTELADAGELEAEYEYETLIDGLPEAEFFRNDFREHQAEYEELTGIRYSDWDSYGGESTWVMIGARVLGIPISQARHLFSGSWTDEEARNQLNALIEAAIKDEKEKAERGELGDEAEG